MALNITPASEQGRAQVGKLGERMQDLTGESVALVDADQCYTGGETFDEAAGHKIIPEVVKLPEARKDFVLLPRRLVVERSFGWMVRSRRLERDYERMATTPAGLLHVAFSMLMLQRAAAI